MDEDSHDLMNSLSDIKRFVFKYRPSGVILDTNVLLLLLIGHLDPKLIEKFSPTTGRYRKEDFDILKKVIGCFKSIIITPHIIAEISNISMREMDGRGLHAYFHSVINTLKSAEEQNVETKLLLDVGVKIISTFGFTDTAMLEISKREMVPLLTDDSRLFEYFSFEKVPVIKLRHIIAYELRLMRD